MDTKPILSLVLLLAASASVFFATGAEVTELMPERDQVVYEAPTTHQLAAR